MEREDETRTGGDCSTPGCCRIESLVTVDERGQMVLPKDLRDRAHIRAGDKLALIGWERQGKICCISLVRADEMSGLVRSFLGPMIKDVTDREE